jgi:phage terminase large subunit-like protein
MRGQGKGAFAVAPDVADFADLLELLAELAANDREALERFVGGLASPVRRRIHDEWGWQAHGGQRVPADGGDWRTWLILAGRGFGKTLAAAQWVWERAREFPGARIALVGGSSDEVRKVMVEGPSGILATARTGEWAQWTPSLGTLRFSTGAIAFAYSAEAPESLRGPEHHFAWADELAKWPRGEAAWDNLQMTLRLGERPRAVATTTPRTTALVRRIEGDPATAVSRGRMRDNPHLPEAFRAAMAALYGGTRLGRQELDGELIADVAGAIWTREVIERARQSGTLPREGMKRVVVGVDPPASVGGDACGIVVCGEGADGRLWVLADASVEGMRPEGWARAVAGAAEAWGADRVVAEKNQGGDMVESVLRGAGAYLPVRLVSATKGKAVRAEPVAALFEAGKAGLAGCFPRLEDEMAGITHAGGYEGPGRSPDRADAMVWAMTELARPARAEPRVRCL